MKKVIKHIFLLVFSLIILPEVFAVPAYPYPITIIQPDGSELTIKLHGDEYSSYKTTLDGYLLVNDEEGLYTYAKTDIDGKLVSAGIRAKNVESRSENDIKILSEIPNLDTYQKISVQKRQARIVANRASSPIQKAFPLTGQPKSLIILVNFSDLSFKISSPEVAYTNLLNEEGYATNGGTGSARDYFKDASNKAFIPQFDVVGPFTLPNPMTYYGENESDYDKNPRQLIIDACTLADKNNVDFAQYDTDNDGYVDNIFVYYAGYNEAENGPVNSIWPHRWTLANNNTKFDGKIVYDYACTSELRGSSGTNMCGIGTFCHEFGHVLGLVDYYATDGSTHHTLYTWNIMDAGPYLNYGRTPPTYSAYDRFFLDWLKPIELNSKQQVTLPALLDSNKAYIITQNGNHNLNGANPNPTEFITLENRQKTGWDAYLPGHGLLITRINFNASTWDANTPNNKQSLMGVDIIEADGIASDNSVSGDAFPGTTNRDSYEPTLRTGVNINKPITYIKETDGVISFRFMGGGDIPTTANIGTTSQFNTVYETPSATQTIKVFGNFLEDSLQLKFEDNNHFQMQLKNNTDGKWLKYIALAANDKMVDTTELVIRYNPTEPSFQYIHLDNLLISSQNAESNRILLAGKSSRPIYVVPPTANEAEKVSLGSFIANWNPVFDASGYYISVYSVSEGTLSKREGFNNGLISPPDWDINASFTTTSSNYSGDSIPAIQFTKTGNYIKTENYLYPATGFSYYVRSMADPNGKLVLEAWDDTKWNLIDNSTVNTTLNETKSFTFSKDLNYLQFKLSYTNTSGYVAIDDLTASFDKNINYIKQHEWTTATADTLTDLISNRTHFYKVKASDKTLDLANTIKYENITLFSNTIEVKTLEDSESKVLRSKIQADGSVQVILSTFNQPILVYNVIGQMIDEIIPTSNIMYITNLPKNQLLILKSGKQYAKIIL